MFFRKNGELRENHKFPRFVTKAATPHCSLEKLHLTMSKSP